MTTIATLCYIIKDNKILLVKKKKGLGVGVWNGPGGTVGNEDISFAASRETYEEIKIVPAEIKKVGDLEFYFGQENEADWHVHVFVTDEFDGIEKETEVAVPKWFKIDRIPYGEMWPDDVIWMPLMIAGKKFHGRFYFDKEVKNLLKHEVKELNETADALTSD